jgi:hypothetical protein
MNDSSFPFIKNKILRENLDITFQHIIDLVTFIENTEEHNDIAKSSFRKTTIISTGSIVEALLFSILDEEFSDQDIQQHYATWELKKKIKLYEVPEGNIKIIAGEYILTPSKVKKEKLNLGQISTFLKENNILENKLYEKIDKLRELRNDQHLGTQQKVKLYTKEDLDNCFAVARDVKNFTKEFLK